MTVGYMSANHAVVGIIRQNIGDTWHSYSKQLSNTLAFLLSLLSAVGLVSLYYSSLDSELVLPASGVDDLRAVTSPFKREIASAARLSLL